MRCAGRIDPGSGGAVCTGQAVFFIPAFTAITRAMLSFFVRPLMVGTVIGGSLDAESWRAPDGVLDAAPRPPVVGAPPIAGALEEAAATTRDGSVDDAAFSVATLSPFGDGCASLLAAQAAAASSERLSNATEEDLLNRFGCISLWGGGLFDDAPGRRQTRSTHFINQA